MFVQNLPSSLLASYGYILDLVLDEKYLFLNLLYVLKVNCRSSAIDVNCCNWLISFTGWLVKDKSFCVEGVRHCQYYYQFFWLCFCWLCLFLERHTSLKRPGLLQNPQVRISGDVNFYSSVVYCLCSLCFRLFNPCNIMPLSFRDFRCQFTEIHKWQLIGKYRIESVDLFKR